MTNTNTYEFTAFTEADLLQGVNGKSIGCGDTFTMPATATTCFTVTDDDGSLSGDKYNNEYGDDCSFQTADIVVNGDQVFDDVRIYAEQYHVLQGSDGQYYYMIEIETAYGDAPGKGDDFFTFYGDVPPAGVELTVVNTCNVTYDWVDYKCLDAGDKEPETGSITGTVFCDDDCDGLHDADVCVFGENLIVNGDFEDNSLNNDGREYNINSSDLGGWFLIGSGKADLFEDGSAFGKAQGDAVIDLDGGAILCQELTITEAGTYQLSMELFSNPSLGASDNRVKIFINGQEVDILEATDGVVTLDLDLDAGPLRLDIKSLSGNSYKGPGIDNIELRQKTVEPGEQGKEGVVVVLLDADGVEVLDDNGQAITTVTDANGDYSFDDVPAGDYRVRFENPDGTEFTFQNVGNDDTIDSDVNGAGVSDVFTVTGGETTENVDAGLKEVKVGALSGTYFCDVDDDAVDDGAANGDADVVGKLVMLFEADGVTPATDADGVLVAAVRTDDEGNYRFDNLAAGDYVVMFESSEAEGKTFVAPNAGNDDAVDSDVVDLVNGKTAPVTVVAGEETKDVDVGVVDANDDPNADDASGKLCAVSDAVDQVVFDLSALTSDPDGDTVTVTSITDAGADGILGTADDGDLAIADGQTVTLTSGAEVSLSGDSLIYNLEGTGAFDDVLIGDTAADLFGYSVSDGEGGSASGQIDIEVCGALNTLETIAASLLDENGDPIQATYRVDAVVNTNPFSVDFPVTVVSDNPVLGGPTGERVFDDAIAYCIDREGDLPFGVDILSEVFVADADEPALADAVVNEQNLDFVNWILNQDFQNLDAGTLDDGDFNTPGATGRNYNFSEVQDAIWFFTDDEVIDANTEFGANSQEIIDAALQFGDDFEAGEGDLVGLAFVPLNADQQTYLVGVPFDELKQDCICD